MLVRRILAAAVATAALLSAGMANAAYVFAGSWRVDQGPAWDGSGATGPLAYTAQEAAALLFGGQASEYVISTAGKAPGAADHLAWYSILGGGIGILDEDYDVKYLGQYYGPTAHHDNGAFDVASAYVNDSAVGDRFTNYAFHFVDDSQAVPEPATWVLAIMGFGLAGAVLRRRPRLAIPARKD